MMKSKIRNLSHNASRTIAFTMILSAGLLTACGSGNMNSSKKPVDTRHVAERSALQVDVLDNQIRPAFSNVYNASKVLNSRAKTFCSNRSDVHLTALKSAWINVATAWAATEIYDASKLSTLGVRNVLYINSFPDSKNLIPNRIDKVLAGKEKIDAQWAADSPATNVGITSIEYVIYGPTSQTMKPKNFAGRRCDLLQAQTNQLELDLQGYDALWKGDYGESFKNSTKSFSGNGAAVSAWYNSALSLVEFMKDRKLGNPAALSTGSVKGHYETRYAGVSKVTYEQNLDALSRAFFGDTANHAGLLAYLRVLGANSVADKLTKQLHSVKAALDAITQENLADTTAEKRKTLYDAMSALAITMKNDVSTVANIQITFNGNDGD